MDKSLIMTARKEFHQELMNRGIWVIDGDGVPSNADVGKRDDAKKGKYNISTRISQELAALVGVPKYTGTKQKGTSTGVKFEDIIAEYIRNTFPKMQHLRPGKWTVLSLGNKNVTTAASFAQYEHLNDLAELAKESKKLMTVLGNDYIVAPDIIVYRDLCNDDEINTGGQYIDDNGCHMADLRKKNGGLPILHASISAKWTMRSDRAQNSRTEALNLIRNRKGHLPHIVVVTAEPTPNRLASLALGTGDIDCVYHFALYELLKAVKKVGSEDAVETLETLVQGKRLKDISDLPLDLTV